MTGDMNGSRETLALLIFMSDWLGDYDITLYDMSPKEATLLKEKWNNDFLPALNTEHYGDCVKVPMTCIRCYVETIMKKADEIGGLLI